MRYLRRVSPLLCFVIGINVFHCMVTAGEAPAPTPLAPVKVNATKDSLDRRVLPIPEPSHPPITALDVRNVKAPPRFEVKTPPAAPRMVCPNPGSSTERPRPRSRE